MNTQYPRMQEKVCLLTGATSGIGKATALELAEQGATVVIVARDRARGEATVKEIQEASKNSSIDLLLADLSSQAAIRQLAADVKDRYEHLHVLINNAGVAELKRRLTVDGLEMTFAVNHLAPLLLNYLLLDVLKSSAPARIINVCSGAHVAGKINLEDLQLEHGYGFWRAYSQSKLAELLCTYRMAALLEGTNVTVNALHPGFVGTNLGMSNITPSLQAAARKTLSLFSLSPEKGARTTLYLAMSPEVEKVTGKYFARCIPVKSSRLSYDQELELRVWEKSLDLVHLSAESLLQTSSQPEAL